MSKPVAVVENDSEPVLIVRNDWDPTEHPRDPVTGKFIEDVTSILSDLSMGDEIVAETAGNRVAGEVVEIRKVDDAPQGTIVEAEMESGSRWSIDGGTSRLIGVVGEEGSDTDIPNNVSVSDEVDQISESAKENAQEYGSKISTGDTITYENSNGSERTGTVKGVEINSVGNFSVIVDEGGGRESTFYPSFGAKLKSVNNDESVDETEDVKEAETTFDDPVDQVDVDTDSRVSDVMESDIPDYKKKVELENLVESETGVSVITSTANIDQAERLTNVLLEDKTSDALRRSHAETVRITDSPGTGYTPRDQESSGETLGYYDPDERTVELSPAGIEEQPSRYTNSFSTSEEGHVVRHEIGHALHAESQGMRAHRELARDRFTAINSSLAEEVSDYAGEHPLELVAEVAAMKMAGEEVPTSGERLYDEFEGPEI